MFTLRIVHFLISKLLLLLFKKNIIIIISKLL